MSGASKDTALGDPVSVLPLFENQSPAPARSRAADTDDLAKLASRINVCLSKAEDNRLKAALHLAKANKACKAAGITFKDWCDSKIKITYDEARKLAKVGESPDPANAMAEMRKSNAKRVKKSRAKPVLRNTAVPARKITDEEKALEAINRLRPETRRNLIRSLAAKLPPEEKRYTISDANDVGAQLEGIVTKSVRGLPADQADKLLKRLRGCIDEMLEGLGKAQESLQMDKSANSDDLPFPPFLDRNRKDDEA
jgi:hypothetical protein